MESKIEFIKQYLNDEVKRINNEFGLNEGKTDVVSYSFDETTLNFDLIYLDGGNDYIHNEMKDLHTTVTNFINNL